MRTCVAALLSLICAVCQAQAGGGTQPGSAYPQSEAATAWRALSASYVRKAMRDRTIDFDPALNARVDAVMSRVGAALAVLDARFARVHWKAILIEHFGHGAAAFPGEIVLVDATFVRAMKLTDDELALMFAHEAAHVAAGHAYQKLAFMAETLGRERAPDARAALLEFLADDSYAEAFQPVARSQEREADRMGAHIFAATGYDAGRALVLFDKIAACEGKPDADSHDSAATRRLAVAAEFGRLSRKDN